ncbi:MAG: hypothetical protein WA865_17080 [Spirulinaceae cyanobacterium]
MNYLVAVLPDRLEAEEAYTVLEKAGFSSQAVSILGRGYKSADEFGFLNPNTQAKKRARLMAVWVVPFGFAAGFAFNSITKIDIVSGIGNLGNHVIGGIFGAIAGAMGSVFVGGGVGLSLGSGDALPYRNRLNEGKYLIVVQGTEQKVDGSVSILQKFNPEEMQGYSD